MRVIDLEMTFEAIALADVTRGGILDRREMRGGAL